MLKSVARVIIPPMVAEGKGARVRRIIGTQAIKNLDPFLMLDHATAGKPAGFPDHPHRGFETVSYILEGVFKHEDFKGHSGILRPGDVQWMTAGRGIMHSEMPDTDYTEGFQLWVNLRSSEKMCEPAYQTLSSESILTVEQNGVTAKIIAGRAMGQQAETMTRTPAYFVDYNFTAGSSVLQEIPAGWNSFVYVLKGTIKINDHELNEHTAGILSNEEGSLLLSSDNEARVIFLAGQPLNEPIVQHGPFVMNTIEEVEQAFIDFQNGENGFEEARTWKSTIGNHK